MSTVQGWMLSLCFAAVAAGVLTMIIPNGSAARVMRILLACFVLCIIITPFTGKVSLGVELPEISSPPTEAFSRLNEVLFNQMAESAADALKPQLEQCVRQCNVEEAEIKLILNRGEDGRIEVQGVQIMVSKEDMDSAGRIRSFVKSQLGLDATVMEAEA